MPHVRRSSAGSVLRRALAVAVAASSLIAAPDARADVQLWTEVGVRRDLSKRWTLTFDQHLRFDEDVSRVSAVMPEPGVSYRVAKWLRLGAGYRLEYERDGSGDLVVRHRVQVAGRARRALGPFRLDYRLQLQESVRPSSNDQYRHTLRNRIDVSYGALPRWRPGGSVELFHALDRGDAIHLDKVWLTAGASYARRKHEVDFFYRLELPQDAQDPDAHILGVGYHLDL